VCEAEVERSSALATALNPYIGYEQAAKLAKEALATGKTVRQLAREKHLLADDVLEKALDPWRMIQPGGE
jgi:fumarate hydratase, class II